MSPLQEPSMLQKDLSESKNLFTKVPKKRQRRSKSGFEEKKDEETNESNLKKIMHRDIERQRRQEMGALYASLRSLLPLEYIRGRRSISDHMHEAVNYIKHMERNTKELKKKRDKLKKNKSKSGGSEDESSDSVDLPNIVTVSSCLSGGIEILISCGLKKKDRFILSRVLMELLQRGLNIVNCIFTKADERFFYRIQFEIDDLAYIDLPELQERLASVINFG